MHSLRRPTLERGAEGCLRNESVLHVDAHTLLVHPASVRLRVTLYDRVAVMSALRR